MERKHAIPLIAIGLGTAVIVLLVLFRFDPRSGDPDGTDHKLSSDSAPPAKLCPGPARSAGKKVAFTKFDMAKVAVPESAAADPRAIGHAISVLLDEAASIADDETRWAKLREIGASLQALGDVYEALRIWQGMEPGFDTRHIFLGIVARYTELAPKEAAAWATGLPGLGAKNPLRLLALETVATTWAAIEPEAALHWAEGLGDGGERAQAVRQALTGWAGSDPANMAEWIGARLAEDASNGRVGRMCGVLADTWARSDPAAAAKWANGLPGDLAARNPAIQKVLLRWVTKDAKAALAFFDEAMAGDRGLEQRTRAILSAALVKQDPLLALEIAEGIGGRLGQARTIEAATALVKKDVKLAQLYFNGLPDDSEVRRSIAPYIAGGLACTDLNAAWKVLGWTGPSGTLSADDLWRVKRSGAEKDRVEEGFRLMMKTWAGLEPKKAVTWLVENQESLQGREAVLSDAVGQWAAKEPEAAALWAVELPKTFQRPSVMAATDAWMRSDLDAAIDFVMTLDADEADEGGLRAEAGRKLVAFLADTQPAAAIDVIERAELDIDAGTARQIVERLAEKEPALAAGWVGEIEEKHLRQAAVSALIDRWYRKSPADAEKWALSLADTEERKRALAQLSDLRDRVE